MSRRHENDAAALAERLRKQNAAGGKRASTALLKAARLGSRATRGQGSFKKRGVVQTLHYQKHRGGLAGEPYAAKKALHSFSNMLSLTSKDRSEEFLIEVARHSRANPANVFVHYSLSLPAGMKLHKDQWELIVKAHLSEVGADGCSFAAHVHDDTDNQHCHVILSRSKPDGRLLSNSNDYWRFREAAAAVADRHLGGRSIERPETKQPTPTSTAAEAANRRARRRGTPPNWINPADIEHCLSRSIDFNAFAVELEKNGIEIRISKSESGEVRGAIFKEHGADEFLAGTSISRQFSLRRIEAALETNRQRAALLHAQRLQQQRNADMTRANKSNHPHPRERG